MKRITRKTVLILSMCLLFTSSAFAYVAAVYDGEVVENTCSLSFNFLGIVKKWTGHKLIKVTNEQGKEDTKSIGCGEDGGSWDWFWE